MVVINNTASQICTTDNRVIQGQHNNNMANQICTDNKLIQGQDNNNMDTIPMNRKTLTMMITKILKKLNGYAK